MIKHLLSDIISIFGKNARIAELTLHSFMFSSLWHQYAGPYVHLLAPISICSLGGLVISVNKYTMTILDKITRNLSEPLRALTIVSQGNAAFILEAHAHLFAGVYQSHIATKQIVQAFEVDAQKFVALQI